MAFDTGKVNHLSPLFGLQLNFSDREIRLFDETITRQLRLTDWLVPPLKEDKGS